MDTTTDTAPSIPRISLTPEEAAAATGLSRTRIFAAIRDGKLTARGDGKATIIEVPELARYVRSMPPKGPQANATSVLKPAADACAPPARTPAAPLNTGAASGRASRHKKYAEIGKASGAPTVSPKANARRRSGAEA